MKIIKVITYLPAIVIMLILVILAVFITFIIIGLEAIQKGILVIVDKLCDFYNFDKDKYTRVKTYE